MLICFPHYTSSSASSVYNNLRLGRLLSVLSFWSTCRICVPVSASVDSPAAWLLVPPLSRAWFLSPCLGPALSPVAACSPPDLLSSSLPWHRQLAGLSLFLLVCLLALLGVPLPGRPALHLLWLVTEATLPSPFTPPAQQLGVPPPSSAPSPSGVVPPWSSFCSLFKDTQQCLIDS